jgi:hypothetical protein
LQSISRCSCCNKCPRWRHPPRPSRDSSLGWGSGYFERCHKMPCARLLFFGIRHFLRASTSDNGGLARNSHLHHIRFVVPAGSSMPQLPRKFVVEFLHHRSKGCRSRARLPCRRRPFPDLFRGATGYIDRVPRGEKPATAALPRSVMNLRRFMCSPPSRISTLPHQLSRCGRQVSVIAGLVPKVDNAPALTSSPGK